MPVASVSACRTIGSINLRACPVTVMQSQSNKPAMGTPGCGLTLYGTKAP